MVRKFLNKTHHFPYDSLRQPENVVPVACKIPEIQNGFFGQMSKASDFKMMSLARLQYSRDRPLRVDLLN